MKALLITLLTLLPVAAHAETATFAGGCFWCTESDFEKVHGVTNVISGYTGGDVDDPSYKQVSAGGTGHLESVEVHYDPQQVSYAHLLEVYWHGVDPYAKDSQFCDFGRQYRSAIFYHDEAQHQAALRTRDKLKAAHPDRLPIQTEILPVARFWPAEDYHQNYYEKNPLRYKLYRYQCGRDQRLDELWGADRIRQ